MSKIDFKKRYKKVCEEWNYEKNLSSIPEIYLPQSHKKVWWKCKKGHEWEAQILSRTHGSGCPYCSGLKFTEENSIFYRKKNLMKEWDYKKNIGVDPKKTSYSSKYMAHWVCKKGHEWVTTVGNRFYGSGCPYCSNRRVRLENSLKTLYPELAKEWNDEKNKLRPEEVSQHTKKRVWWKCRKGHEWEDRITSRVNGKMCRECKKMKD